MTERIISPEWVVGGRADVLVDGTLREGWGIRSAPLVRGASYTDFSSNEMAVPTGDTPADAAVRLHELIHARISPTKVPHELMRQLGVTTEGVKLAEEVRVNLLGRMIGDKVIGDTKDLADGSEQGLADNAVTRNSWNDALNLFLTTFNTDIHKTVKRRLRRNPEWREPLDIISKWLGANGYRYDPKVGDRHAISKHRLRDTSATAYRWYEKKTPHLETLPDGFMNHAMPLAHKIDEWTENPPMKPAPEGMGSRRHKPIDGEWDNLRFGMTSLTETTAFFLGRRKRPAMVGKYPTRPDRLLTDPERRIFRETVRSNGGIVVFDCSGSMGISHETVKDVVKQFAGATVVLYSTRGDNTPNVWVVADNGRMISEEDFGDLSLHCGNCIDGPVLQWAVRRRKNTKDFILWVSDGQVTGKHDTWADSLLLEAALFQRKHKIIGAENAEEALQILADMKRGVRTPQNKYVRQIKNTLNLYDKEQEKSK